VQAGIAIEEVPITFVDRAHGSSKMSMRIIVESMARVTMSGLRSRLATRSARRR
jgi:dolichol-phosphate mannosyltransferase